MISKSARDLLCNNSFSYQSSTATHLQNVFTCLMVRIVRLDCFVAVIMTHCQLTPPLEVISKKLFLIAFVLFWTNGVFQLRLSFGMINIHLMKKKVFFSVIMIFPQLFCQTVKHALVTLERNFLPKSSVQRRLSPINSCLLDDL